MGQLIISFLAINMSASDVCHTAKNKTIEIAIADGYLRYLDSNMATLKGINMTIPGGQWTCILGRSGCGKTSLLRYLAGLLEQRIHWSGELQVKPADCDLKNEIAYMAQQDLLMPWLSVIDNVMLSDKFGNATTRFKKHNALALLHKVGLADNANHLPQQLSGGMRQRVALARTLMQDKPVVLMDEPFSALDAVTRYRLQDLACELLQGKTVVLITHDPQEAIRLANQIYIMHGKPSSVERLNITHADTPRKFDAQFAQLQQSIMDSLEQEYA